jgi:ABC-type Mn2+/Zn2+ transport system ATPase subunit
MNIEPGSLVMVAGPVAGGKSNFVKGLLGELTVREGSCTVSRSKAYVDKNINIYVQNSTTPLC